MAVSHAGTSAVLHGERREQELRGRTNSTGQKKKWANMHRHTQLSPCFRCTFTYLRLTFGTGILQSAPSGVWWGVCVWLFVSVPFISPPLPILEPHHYQPPAAHSPHSSLPFTVTFLNAASLLKWLFLLMWWQSKWCNHTSLLEEPCWGWVGGRKGLQGGDDGKQQWGKPKSNII